MKNQIFLPENFQFLVVKFPVYLNRHVFVMQTRLNTVNRSDGHEITESPLVVSLSIVTPSVRV